MFVVAWSDAKPRTHRRGTPDFEGTKPRRYAASRNENSDNGNRDLDGGRQKEPNSNCKSVVVPPTSPVVRGGGLGGLGNAGPPGRLLAREPVPRLGVLIRAGDGDGDPRS
jgi:hypothetical protein